MTLLEKQKQAPGIPPAEEPRRFEWVMWVVLAFLIVAGITAGILLSTGTEGVPVEEVNAELAFDNSIAAGRIAALQYSIGQDGSLASTAHRILEQQFPGRLDMLETSALRADQALRNTIDRTMGG